MAAGIVAAVVIKPYDYRLGLLAGLGLVFAGALIQVWCFYEAWHQYQEMIRLHNRSMENLQDLQRRAEEATTDEEKIAIIHELCDTNPEAAKMLKGVLDSNSSG